MLGLHKSYLSTEHEVRAKKNSRHDLHIYFIVCHFGSLQEKKEKVEEKSLEIGRERDM